MDHLPGLNEAGRLRLEASCVSFVVNQLMLSDHIRKHPEVLEQKIERPVFVFGAPRTGTSLVNALLMQDPGRRTLLNWEVMDPAPPAAPGALFTDPRIAERQRLHELGIQSFTGMNKTHMETAAGPPNVSPSSSRNSTRCTGTPRFRCAATPISCWIATWFPPTAFTSRCCRYCDMVSTYRFHKQMLQVLQSGNPGIWNLKMPSRAIFLEALLEVYPDARLVWTHRDPFKALGSLCSLVETVSATNITPMDTDFMRWNYPRQAAEHHRRPHALRERLSLLWHILLSSVIFRIPESAFD